MLETFREVVVVDFEFTTTTGGRPGPICLVAHEQRVHVKGVYAAHRDQSHATQLVRKLAEHLAQRYGIQVTAVPAPPLRAEGYVQLRGFGYVLRTQ